MSTYTLTDATAAFRYSLFAGLQRLTRERNGHGTAMAASSVNLAAFDAGRHASLVSWRKVLWIELGVEDTATTKLLASLNTKSPATIRVYFSAYFLLPI